MDQAPWVSFELGIELCSEKYIRVFVQCSLLDSEQQASLGKLDIFFSSSVTVAKCWTTAIQKLSCFEQTAIQKHVERVQEKSIT